MDPMLSPVLQPEEDESQRCQFCPYRGKLTQEHLWPETYKKWFPQITEAHHQRYDVRAPQGAREWDGPPFQSTVGIDCNDCNNEQLRKIERAALVWVVGMARGLRPVKPLLLDTQRKLAAFTLRMVAVSQYTHPELRPVPRSHREHLVTHRAPPPMVDVWLSYYEGHDAVFRIQGMPLGVSGPNERPPIGPNAYHGFVRMGHLILEIASRTDGPFPYPLPKPDSRTFIPIWPIEFNRIGIWPPERALDDAGLSQRLAAFDQGALVWVELPPVPTSQPPPPHP